MKKRKLGNSGLLVAPIAFGGNVFGWTADEKTSFDLLDKFAGAGFNLIDTADVYSRWNSGVGGESETIIGKWMKQRGNRDKVIIATKGGMDMGQGKTDVSKQYLIKAAEDSLKRLQIECIDLYQTHKDDETIPVEEALEAYAQLIREGKIKYIGASNFSAERLSLALEASKKYNLPRYETLQPLYNLCDREVFEKELEPLCVNNNIGVLNYYSLAAGFLTGKYRTKDDLGQSVRGAKVSNYMNERCSRILKAVDEVAAKHKTNNASVAIAWLLNRPSVSAPIASATGLKQLDAIIDSVNIELDHEDLTLLNKASEWGS
jgi:aryl-alcohol dehydrogenase-like predicted oxidoreductase